MKNFSLYVIITLLLTIIFGWLYLNNQSKKYEKLYNDCIEGRSIDTVYIDTTTHHIDILSPIVVKETKKKIETQTDSLGDDINDFILNQYSNIIDEYYVDREYVEHFGDSLLSITLKLNATGKINSISPSWKLTMSPIINRIDTVTRDIRKKNQYYFGVGVGTDTTLNVSLLFINKKRSAFSCSVNTLDLIDNQFPKMQINYYYHF